MTTTLIIPGLYSSGPDHWQTWFEQQLPGTVRVIQSDWTKPDLPEWAGRVKRDIARTPGRHLLVAHSFGVLAAVYAASRIADRIDGAFLVAPADPDKFGVSTDLPNTALPFPAAVVASANDPWMRLWRAAEWADKWGADFVNLGDAGHINAESGFGAWPEGLGLLERIRRRSQQILPASAHFSASEPRVRPAAWRTDAPSNSATPRQFVRRGATTGNRLGVG